MGPEYLAPPFREAASLMHEWLGEQLDALHTSRGSKINVIGPRGSAKSTIATLCYVLRAAVEGWEPYIWIVSDTKEQAQHPSGERESRADRQSPVASTIIPNRCGQGGHWRATSIQLGNGVVIESYGTGQSIRGRRRSADRPSLIVCDDLQNDSHISSAPQREASRQWFHGTLLNAGTKETNIVNLATALHREALALELHRIGGLDVAKLSGRSISGPRTPSCGTNGTRSIAMSTTRKPGKCGREFYERIARKWMPGAVVLWPEVEDLYTLMQMRVEIGHTAFEREKQGSPVNPEFCEWPESYFADHIWFDGWPERFARSARSRSIPSKGRDAGRGDYSAYVLLGIDSARRDLRRGRHGPPTDAANGRRRRGAVRAVSSAQRSASKRINFKNCCAASLPASSPGKGSATLCPPRFTITRISSCGFAGWDRICRNVDCGFWRTRRPRGCSWINSAISHRRRTTTAPTRSKWRCALPRTFGTSRYNDDGLGDRLRVRMITKCLTEASVTLDRSAAVA